VFVAVIHRIHDPDGFRAAERDALATGLPDGVALPVHGTARDHRLAVCLWEGASVTAVRDVVERAVGPFADNEYYAMDIDGLVPQLPG
jgi:hypothetical protein